MLLEKTLHEEGGLKISATFCPDWVGLDGFAQDACPILWR